MGDPKKARKKYSTPRHPWIKGEIDANKALRREYGLTKRKEVQIASSFLSKYKDIAKRLIADRTAQGEKEKQQIISKLQQLGLLPAGADLDQILGLEVKDVLERRLQSIVARKGLARSMKQARQFIVHRHVKVEGKEITAPSYLVTLAQENQIAFKDNSALADEEHPERSLKSPEAKVEVKPAEETKEEAAPAKASEESVKTPAKKVEEKKE